MVLYKYVMYSLFFFLLYQWIGGVGGGILLHMGLFFGSLKFKCKCMDNKLVQQDEKGGLRGTNFQVLKFHIAHDPISFLSILFLLFSSTRRHNSR